MSFAVRLDSAPRVLHRRVSAALAGFALAASSFALVFADASQRGWIALAAVACFGVAFARRRLRRAARVRGGERRGHRGGIAGVEPAQGSLGIDEAGRATWSDAERGDGPKPVKIERWNVLGPFAWLQLRLEGGAEALDVLLVRRGRRAGACDAVQDDWRRLRAWLLWYGRGAAPSDALSTPRRARQ